MTDASPQWVSTTTDETFQADVFERSRKTPVVVDFWADHCRPCHMLAPKLVALAEEMDGKFQLVKAETEHNQQAATEFQVDSIPAVYGVVGGEVVDFFQGVIPDDMLKEFVERLIAAQGLVDVRNLEDSDPAEAEKRYRAMLDDSPDDDSVLTALARTCVAQGKTDEAQQMLEQLEERGFLEPEAEHLKAALHLKQTGGNLESARAAAEAAPDDLGALRAYAEALAGAKHYDQAMAVCLRLVEKDRSGEGEAARKLMLEIFQVDPDTDSVNEFRRRLSSLLY